MSRGLRLALAIGAVVVLLDQLTKHWAVNALADGRPRHVAWTLQWNLSFNSGMAFSTGQGAGVLIGLVAVVVMAAIIRAVVRTPTLSRWALVAAGLVLGGALGNVVDRLFRGPGWMHGAVVDFVDLQWFPIFNIADAAINVGAMIYLMWALVLEPRSRPRS